MLHAVHIIMNIYYVLNIYYEHLLCSDKKKVLHMLMDGKTSFLDWTSLLQADYQFSVHISILTESARNFFFFYEDLVHFVTNWTDC